MARIVCTEWCTAPSFVSRRARTWSANSPRPKDGGLRRGIGPRRPIRIDPATVWAVETSVVSFEVSLRTRPDPFLNQPHTRWLKKKRTLMIKTRVAGTAAIFTFGLAALGGTVVAIAAPANAETGSTSSSSSSSTSTSTTSGTSTPAGSTQKLTISMNLHVLSQKVIRDPAQANPTTNP